MAPRMVRSSAAASPRRSGGAAARLARHRAPADRPVPRRWRSVPSGNGSSSGRGVGRLVTNRLGSQAAPGLVSCGARPAAVVAPHRHRPAAAAPQSGIVVKQRQVGSRRGLAQHAVEILEDLVDVRLPGRRAERPRGAPGDGPWPRARSRHCECRVPSARLRSHRRASSTRARAALVSRAAEIVPAVAAAIGGLKADVAAGRTLHRTGLIVSADGRVGRRQQRTLDVGQHAIGLGAIGIGQRDRAEQANGVAGVPGFKQRSRASQRDVAGAHRRQRVGRDWPAADSAAAAGHAPPRQFAKGAGEPERPTTQRRPRPRPGQTAPRATRGGAAGNSAMARRHPAVSSSGSVSAGRLAPESRSSRPRYASATSVGAPCSTAAVSSRRAATTWPSSKAAVPRCSSSSECR